MATANRTRSDTTSFLRLDQSKVLAEAKKLSKTPEALATVFSFLYFAFAERKKDCCKELDELRSSVADLSKTVAELQKSNAALAARLESTEPPVSTVQSCDSSIEDRLLKSESYSGRSTSIMTGIPEDPSEDITEVVAKHVREIIPDFTANRISTAHRNKKKDPTKPRSVTVVFSHIRDKDIVSDYRRQGPLRKKNVGVYHYTPPAVLKRKKELEECEGVSKVYFDGPIKMFSVKMSDKTVKRRITNVNQLIR